MRNWLVLGLVVMMGQTAKTQDSPGAPGTIGTWPRPDKLGYGTTANRPVWFTIADGVIGEITYPRVDLVQTRDTFIILKDGKNILDERTLKNRVRRAKGTLAYSVESSGQGILVQKNVAISADRDAIIIDYHVEFASNGERQVILVHNPLVSGTPGGDMIQAVDAGQNSPSLVAFQGDVRGDEPEAMHVRAKQLVTWSIKDSEATVGYEGASAPEDQINAGVFPRTYLRAGPGNVAGALYKNISGRELNFRVVLQFFEKDAIRDVKTDLNDLLRVNLESEVSEQRATWRKYLRKLDYDENDMRMESSILVLKALEDKAERGAYIAGSGNPNLPWMINAQELDYEQSRRRVGDSNFGYRRVWPRDLYHKAMAFLAVEDGASAVQIARWYKKTQFGEGWWSQNMFVDGYPSWRAYQQDETALPVVLVAHLVERKLVDYVEFRDMARRALNYLIARGPSTDQERWEENGGISPNSLGAAVQALWGGYWLENHYGDAALANRYREVAQEWTNGIKVWNLIPNGRFGSNYFARLETGNNGRWDPTYHGSIKIGNKNEQQKAWYREDEILDLGFVQWIIAGVIPANDADFMRTLEICDRSIMGDSPYGRGYFRYNEDAYGQEHRGGLWPLLSGERILAAIENGENYNSHLQLIENMFSESGMLGEQDTLAIRPLGWSHANYLIVRRSIAERRSFYRFQSMERLQKR
jgi:glucoamylase